MVGGERVIDRERSHIHRDVKRYLKDALGKVDAKGREYIEETVNFENVSGEAYCVETDGNDEIVYAKRPNRDGYSRFVLNKNGQITNRLTIVLKKAVEKNSYVLITAYWGEVAEPEPWDKRATPKSRKFWEKHALVWGSVEAIKKTRRKSCPW